MNAKNMNTKNMNTKKYAYVWLVMLGDRYVPGAIVSAFSCKKHSNIKCDYVCLITHDVSEQAINELKKVFNRIIKIDYIEIESKMMRTDKQQKMYPWINKSYTKWNVIKLDEYNKVLFIDADTLCVNDLSSLFSIDTPAACFYSPFFTKINDQIISNYKKTKDIKTTNLFGKKEFTHGSIVPKKIIHDSLFNNGMTINAGLVLLTPNKNDFKEFVYMLTDVNYDSKLNFNSFSGYDEQSLAYYYAFYRKKKQEWHNISRLYNFYIIREDIKNIKYAHLIHYIGTLLTWEAFGSEYADQMPWNIYCKHAIKELKLDVTKLNFNKFLLEFIDAIDEKEYKHLLQKW